MRAAYQALYEGLRAELADPSAVVDHLALVSQARRELLGDGRTSLAMLGALAGLRDLDALVQAGEDVPPELAEAAIAESHGYVERLRSGHGARVH